MEKRQTKTHLLGNAMDADHDAYQIDRERIALALRRVWSLCTLWCLIPIIDALLLQIVGERFEKVPSEGYNTRAIRNIVNQTDALQPHSALPPIARASVAPSTPASALPQGQGVFSQHYRAFAVHVTSHRTNKTAVVASHRSETVGQIRAKIEATLGVPVGQQTLHVGSRLLDDDNLQVYRLSPLANECSMTLTEHPLKIKIKLPRLDPKSLGSTPVYSSMTIWELKVIVEDTFGLPVSVQRIGYLEDLDIRDTLRLFDCNIVSGATVIVALWPNFETPYTLVVTDSPLPSVMRHLEDGVQSQTAWALFFVAAFRGRIEICRAMLEAGADGDLSAGRQYFEQGPKPFGELVPGFRPCDRGTGRTPLHAGACVLMHVRLLIM